MYARSLDRSCRLVTAESKRRIEPNEETGFSHRRLAGRSSEIMLSLQALSDRAEIQDLIVAEANAMDRRDWNRWQSVFTPDARIDYSENDGATGTPYEVRTWLASVLGRFHSYQHLSSNLEIELADDRASVRTMQYIAVKMETSEGTRVVFSGIWFRDEVVRTGEGWRIAARYEELAWRHNFPEDFEPPTSD